MVRHTTDAVKSSIVFHGVAVNIGIQFPLMLFFYRENAAMGTKDDMIDKICVTHNATKVTKNEGMSKFWGRLRRHFLVCRYPW